MTDINLERKLKKAKDLEDANNDSYRKLRQVVPTFRMETGGMRLELLFDSLVVWGAITAEQRADFEITFHEKIQETLDEVWRQYHAAKKAPKLTVVKEPAKKLTDQHGRPLT